MYSLLKCLLAVLLSQTITMCNARAGFVGVTTHQISAENTINEDEGANGFVYSTASLNSEQYTSPTSWDNDTSGGTLVATFTPTAGSAVEILGLGIGGDVRGGVATVVYSLNGGGLDFAFSAGNTTYDGDAFLIGGGTGSVLYTLIGGAAAMTAEVGQTVELRMHHRIDYDGQALNGDVDPFGNVFNDVSIGPHSSAQRVWVNYQATSAPVPEPTSIAMWSVLGCVGMVVRRRQRKSATA